MIEDFRQFLKFYRMYKKGKEDMEKVKEFINNHQKDIIVGLGFLVSYQVGFRRGFRNGIKFEDAMVGFIKRAKS